jgi:hypothetical protein
VKGLLSISLVLILATSAPCSIVAAQDKKPDLFDPIDPSKAFDLTDLPVGVTLLQMMALELRDRTLGAQFEADLDKLREIMETSIGKNGLGYLLRVQIYSDEFGTPVVPAGQLVFSIGAGTEPADALAEFIRRPGLEADKPKGLRDESYYLWVKRKDGKLVAGAIPREFRENLDETARQEADRRNLLGDWQRALPDGGFKAIQRAEYWNEVATKYSHFLQSQEDRDRVEAIRKQFNDAQDKFNEAYKKYLETEAELASQAQFSRALDTISAIGAVLNAADKLGAFQSTTAGPVKTDAKPQANLGATIEYSKTRINELTGSYEEQRVRIQLQGDQLQKLDGTLRGIYQKDNIPIPKAQDPLPSIIKP